MTWLVLTKSPGIICCTSCFLASTKNRVQFGTLTDAGLSTSSRFGVRANRILSREQGKPPGEEIDSAMDRGQ